MKFFASVLVVICSTAAQPILANGDAASAPRIIQLAEHEDEIITVWLETSLKRVFPQSPPGSTDLQLLAARNSTIAFQVCLRNNSAQVVPINCRVLEADELAPRVRFVGLTPVPHATPGTPLHELDGGGKFIPGLVPDALWPWTTAEVNPFESRSFWVTLRIPAAISPGERLFRVRLSLKDRADKAVDLLVPLTTAPLVLARRENFPVTHWWWPQSNADQYKTGMFDDKWWRVTRAQMENMFDHGSDVVYVPMFTFAFPKIFERPGQLLIVREPAPGVYQFDWSRVKRFTDMCREVGFRQFEWSHLWRQWSVDHPVLVYKLEEGKLVNLWPVDEPPLSPKYTGFLTQFLPEFKKFLDEEQLLDGSYFHLADEPQDIDKYRAAREFLRGKAPWMKVMDAVQHLDYAQQKLTDIPIPLISEEVPFAEQGISHWVYYCCGPTGEYLNRFMDTPLPKIRMSGWTFYRLRASGFLHWGYNYWNKLNEEESLNPFLEPTARSSPWIPAGDPFVIYPGPDEEPLDSIRWEVFAESLQDYAMLKKAGISPDDKLLSEIKSYKDFPKTEEWLDRARRRILLGPEASNASEATAPE